MRVPVFYMSWRRRLVNRKSFTSTNSRLHVQVDLDIIEETSLRVEENGLLLLVVGGGPVEDDGD